MWAGDKSESEICASTLSHLQRPCKLVAGLVESNGDNQLNTFVVQGVLQIGAAVTPNFPEVSVFVFLSKQCPRRRARSDEWCVDSRTSQTGLRRKYGWVPCPFSRGLPQRVPKAVMRSLTTFFPAWVATFGAHDDPAKSLFRKDFLTGRGERFTRSWPPPAHHQL